MKKKGISPFISTILLIGFIVVLIVLIFLWGRNYIEELVAKRGALAEKEAECVNVDITVISSYQLADSVFVNVKNKKNVRIDKFAFRIAGDETEVAHDYNKLEGLEIKQYELKFSESDVGEVNEVTVIPWLKAGRGKFVPCTKQSVTAKVSAAEQ